MRRINLIATAGLLGLAIGGCADHANRMAETAMIGGKGTYDPSTNELYRLYEYYPNEQVYYGVHRNTWWWQCEQGWMHGTTLPEGCTVGNDCVLIELPTAAPNRMHNDVLAMYPTNEMLAERLAQLESESLQETFASVPTN